MRYKPVCGNNNRTYHNYCVLRCVRLKHNKTIQMEHRWECGTLPSEWEELEAAAEPVASDVNIPFASLGAFNDTAERWENDFIAIDH
ncbi:extracellular protease inhibitor 10-like [Anopheles stephensi]|uniref:extracellular protease inhibitor 10-like n=1 Tax=Anopheles stephensi TaxID=30069 RepID=UPI001658B8D9|nr:extracellular protease inhibitor 10-like [Anopheles stephensi]